LSEAKDLVCQSWQVARAAKAHARKQHSWPTAQGKVVESRVEYSNEFFYPVVAYTYEHDARVIQGKRICSFEITGNWRSTPEKWVRKYPVGSTVTVFVDPDDPHNSVLEPGADKKFLPLALTISGVLILLGVRFLYV
jgi:hypothetical protein